MIGGLVMVGIGIFFAIPIFGKFGIFWTLMSLGITGYHAYLAFSDNAAEEEINIKEDYRLNSFNLNSSNLSLNNSIESRLRKLEELRMKDLVTEEEYLNKKNQILDDL